MSRVRCRSMPSVQMHSVGSTPAATCSMFLKTAASFRWFRLRLWSSVAESKRLMPGQSTPFSFDLSEVQSGSPSIVATSTCSSSWKVSSGSSTSSSSSSI